MDWAIFQYQLESKIFSRILVVQKMKLKVMLRLKIFQVRIPTTITYNLYVYFCIYMMVFGFVTLQRFIVLIEASQSPTMYCYS